MKLAYENFSAVIETSTQNVIGIIIENPIMLYRFLVDMRETMEGNGGGVVLSNDNKVIDFAKNAELLTDFIQFDLNQKTLLSKIIASIDKISESDSFYNSSRQLLTQIENLIMEMTINLPCDLVCEKLSMTSVIKAMGISLVDEYSSLEEKILAYMDLVRDFLGKRLFIFVNVRGFISYSNLQKLADTASLREHELLFIDNAAYPRLKQEKRLIIDKDLCEI